ncbi:DUF4176 domain-containing protein [Bacillus carboniphilus]|uniref:DUF4176 domain-containing protein n=1 Tax=Bacillus carboniphilus TaxID=86663 RepID=A0ABY9JT06_9BACI|nr:DUF4176 domain-containing protein [Bacillus carboniphilus]WLR41403.1 DUF4176 domain-containing protein [Bacillus carboniphilus]
MIKKNSLLTLMLILVLILAGCSQTNKSDSDVSSKDIKTEENSPSEEGHSEVEVSTENEHIEIEESDLTEYDTNKLLPIGTVIKVKQFTKPVMIYGHNQIQTSTGKSFDYIAVPYPEGNISPDYNMFLNRNMIEEVLYIGYITEEDKKLREEVELQIKNGK